MDTIEIKNKTITIGAQDIVYLYSDGYIDQFGGVKGRRYQRRFFKELLLKNANQSMSMQKQALKNEFEQWKGLNEQIDDVLVVGIRLKNRQ